MRMSSLLGTLALLGPGAHTTKATGYGRGNSVVSVLRGPATSAKRRGHRASMAQQKRASKKASNRARNKSHH